MVLGVIGDLVEDIVVVPDPAVATRDVAAWDMAAWRSVRGTDTAVRVERRRGGSAANVAAVAAGLGSAARFIGRVGDDAAGRALVAGLQDDGVDVVGGVGGRTGTIVVLVDADGERSFLTDRGAAVGLDHVDPAWLDGLTWLHLPAYSLDGEPLAASTRALVAAAHRRCVPVSIDVSSVALLRAWGPSGFEDRLADIDPAVAFANADEAEVIGAERYAACAEITIVKRGAASALVRRAALGPEAVEVPAEELAVVPDTTGAGDAFAAGCLVALSQGIELTVAVRRGHGAAARHLRQRGAII